MSKIEVLVVGDIHAMSPEVDVGRVVAFLERTPAKVLVLAGDTLDFYIWRHSRWHVDVAGGMKLLEALIGLVERGMELVVIPGNHDMDWLWMAGVEVWPKRQKAYPAGMEALMERLLGLERVRVVHEYRVGETLIIHGHRGWQGDWMWRIAEMGDRATGYRMVGGKARRKVMGNAPNVVRAAAMVGHGFYRRLGAWARRRGISHIIHGHTHVDGRRVRGGVVMDCLSTWRPGEGVGGGIALKNGVWERVS